MRAQDIGSKPGRRTRKRVLAAAVLTLAASGAGCLAFVSSNPLEPLRALTRWSLEWRGARFVARGGIRLQSSLTDCGPTALADFLELAGLAVPSADSLNHLAATDQNGTTLQHLESAALATGLRVFAVQWDPAELSALPLPSLVWVDRRHFVVVARRVSNDSVEIHDPAAGLYRMTIDRFARSWSGDALIPLDSISRRRPDGVSAARPHRPRGTRAHRSRTTEV